MGDQAVSLLTSIRTTVSYVYILLLNQILITPTLQYNFSVKSRTNQISNSIKNNTTLLKTSNLLLSK